MDKSNETISLGSSSEEMGMEEWIATVEESVFQWMDDNGARIIGNWLTERQGGANAPGVGGRKKVKAPIKKESSFWKKGE